AEAVAGRRAAGQRTHELSAGASATLDSPGTRMWMHVLGEVQRRIGANEGDLLSRCEGVRRGETERFRDVSAQTSTLLQDLASCVGCSDDRWAAPPCAVRGNLPIARKPGDFKPALLQPPQPSPPPPPSASSKATISSTQRWSQPAPVDEGTPGLPVGITRVAVGAAVEGRLAARTPAEETIDVRATEPAGLGRAGVDGAGPDGAGLDPAGLDRAGLDRARAGAREEGFVAVADISKAGPARKEGFAQARHFSKEAASLPRGQATTMASAATVLLARVVAVEKRDHLSAGSPASQVCAEEEEEEEEEPVARETGAREQPSPRMRHGLEFNLSGNSEVGAGAERKGRALSAASGEGELRGGEGGVLSIEDEWRRPVGSRSVGNAPEALRSPSRRGHVRTSPAPTGSAWAERPDAATAEVEGPIASVDRTKNDSRNGVTGGDASDIGSAGGGRTGVTEGEGRPEVGGVGERRRSSEDATEHLLREASRVKGLLATMDRADSASTPGDDGLRDEDPGRFLASLGLVELKPLAGRLAEALERTPQALLCDPAVPVPEPRTARGLRDQVAALGKEVSQRAEACAEARKLHAALRRQVEVARRGRARNLDTIDSACRKLTSEVAGEARVLRDSRHVAQEAQRYHATLGRLQGQVDAAVTETRKIVSASEAIARRLRSEMDGRGGELSDRRRAAMEGLAEWEREADGAPALRALRRAYDCEIIVLRHRMGVDGANRASLAAAFHQLRTRTRQQRRARTWFASASARRDTRLARAAFDALARASRFRAAAAAAAAARRRAGFAAWRLAASLARQSRFFRLRKDRERAVKALRRWRQCVGKSGGGGRGGGGGGRVVGVEEEERGALEWRLEVFRERRAKRVVFEAWWSAVQTAAAAAAMRGEASLGMVGSGAGHGRRWGVAHRGGVDRDEVMACRGWGARLRNAEAAARRRRFETQASIAFRWWRRMCQCNRLGKVAGQRRALKRWRRTAIDARLTRQATAEARGSYVVALGRRVLAAWHTAATTRACRRAGAAAFVTASTKILKRRACARWASQAAAATLEAGKTATALEHGYDRCLRGHLRAWLALARERRVLRRGAELLLRGRRAAAAATGFRLWRRRAAEVREAGLRSCRIKAWAGAAARRRRLGALSLSFSAWSSTSRRTAAVRSLAQHAAARRNYLSLSRGFRALSLAGRRTASVAAASVLVDDIAGVVGGGGGGGGGRGGSGGTGNLPGAGCTPESVRAAVLTKTALEGKVGQLRARLAQERARVLERRASASKITEKIERCERERTRHAKMLQRREDRSSASTAVGGEKGVGAGGSKPPRRNGKANMDEEGVISTVAFPAFGLSELMEREGEQFGKLQAKTIEMQQRVASLREQEAAMRANAAQKAAATKMALQEAVAEGRLLKEEADKREALCVQLDLEAKRATAQAASLLDRLAGAEQELGFEATRNAERLHAKNEDNIRLRAAAIYAEKRLTAAENVLRRKGREIEELRLKGNQAGLRGKAGGGVGGVRRSGVRDRVGSATAGLEFRVFAAAADARSAVQRCATAAVERRSAAGSVLADALRVAGAEGAETDAARVNRELAEARRVAGDNVTDERRAVAGLALRGAEARLRRSADLTLRAALDRRPIESPRSLLATDGCKDSVTAAVHFETDPTRTAGAPTGDAAGCDRDRDSFNHASGGEASRRHRRPDQAQPAQNTCALGKTVVAATVTSVPSLSDLDSGQHGGDSDCETVGGAVGSRDSQELHRDCDAKAELEAAPADGLRELRREISDLESKIIGRLNGGDLSASSNSGHDDFTSGENAVLSAEELPPWRRSDGDYAAIGAENTDGNDIAQEMEPSGLVPIGTARASSRKTKTGRARGQRPRTLPTRVSSSLPPPPPPPPRRHPARAEQPASSTRERDDQPLGRNVGRTALIAAPRTRVKRAKRPSKKTAPANRVAPPDRGNGGSGSYGNRSSISFAAVAAPTRSLPGAPRMSARDGTGDYGSVGGVGG
ncbi:unnamed protein product, partial [Laminaria digitata]